MSGDVGAEVAAIVAALNPTWHRGMHGCPDDMYAARDLRNQLAPIIAERVAAAKVERDRSLDVAGEQEWGPVLMGDRQPAPQVCTNRRCAGPCSYSPCACLAGHATPHHDALGRVIPPAASERAGAGK